MNTHSVSSCGKFSYCGECFAYSGVYLKVTATERMVLSPLSGTLSHKGYRQSKGCRIPMF